MKLLPFPKKPMFLCYHNRAFPFGVVQANSPEDITKWGCTKGVYCFFHPEQKMNKFCFAVDDLWSLGERLWKSIFLAKNSTHSNIEVLKTNRNKQYRYNESLVEGVRN